MKLALEKSCKRNEVWFDEHVWKYPEVEHVLITKYVAEMKIGGHDGVRFEKEAKIDLSPLYPLLTIPDPENPRVRKFQER